MDSLNDEVYLCFIISLIDSLEWRVCDFLYQIIKISINADISVIGFYENIENIS